MSLRRLRTSALCALLLCSGPALAATLAVDGTTSHRIILADDAIPAERTAAEELARYLERSTSARFEIVTESEDGGEAEPAIWVGPTRIAREHGVEAERLGPEAWRILVRGEQLVLAGGRPRGTLYAVYRFLEDRVGVRWWTPFEEEVPLRALLTVEGDSAGEPAFGYRDFHGIEGPSLFHARNRANGHYSFLTEEHGGREAYGPPFMVHTFDLYLPPDAYFETHPELFAERDGRRVGENSQLCLTSDKLLDVVEEKLDGYIAQGRAEAEARGERPPRLYDFSPNDWDRPCQCEPCSVVDAREGAASGSLVHFMNRLAARIADDHPELLLDTLAYHHTLQPPAESSLADNVVVRFAALRDRDFSKPISHRANRRIRKALEGWRERTGRLRIWAYAVTFGWEANNLPLPNLEATAADFRYYQALGVDGLFVQQFHPLLSDMRDLKSWVLFKLAEDPSRDVEALVYDFTEGYYGAAGEIVREYRSALKRAARLKRSPILYPVEADQYRYLTAGFLRRAQAMFDRAEARVGDDSVLLRRLRHARLPLDRATLLRWKPKLAVERRCRKRAAPIDPEAVAGRYRRTAAEQIEIRFRPARQAEQWQKAVEEIEELLDRIRDPA